MSRPRAGTPSSAGLPAPRGRKARLRGDERQALIVAALDKALKRRSIGDITVEELAAEAGVNRASFYFYFESKLAVLAASVDTVRRTYLAAHEEALSAAQNTATLDLQAAADATVDAYATHAHLLAAFASAAETDPAMGELYREHLREFASAATRFIDAERDAARAPEGLDSELLGSYLASADMGFLNAKWQSGELGRSKRGTTARFLAGVWTRAIYATDASPTPDGS